MCFTCAVLHHIQYPTLLLNVRLKEGMASRGPAVCRPPMCSVMFCSLRISPEISARAGELCDRLAPRGHIPGHGFQRPGRAGRRRRLPSGISRGGRRGGPRFAGAMEAAAHKRRNSHSHDRFDPGHPIPAILQVLESQDISLIVMGTQGKGFIKEIFLGSVAHNVSRLATCPVLLIPPETR